MKTIWKFQIGKLGKSTLQIPEGYQVLDFQMQDRVPCLWVLIDLRSKAQKAEFLLVGTGNPFDEGDVKYVGTVQDGGLVWHLFDLQTQEVARQKRIDDSTDEWVVNSLND